jgi:hypothetical protein
MADDLMTARDYFGRARSILDRAEDVAAEGSARRTNLLLEAATNALLAVGMGLGVHLPPLPGLDSYCLCSDALTRLAKHETDCPHYKPTNDEGPAASPTEPSA